MLLGGDGAPPPPGSDGVGGSLWVFGVAWQKKRNNVGDLINETLEMLEMYGGPVREREKERGRERGEGEGEES